MIFKRLTKLKWSVLLPRFDAQPPACPRPYAKGRKHSNYTFSCFITHTNIYIYICNNRFLIFLICWLTLLNLSTKPSICQLNFCICRQFLSSDTSNDYKQLYFSWSFLDTYKYKSKMILKMLMDRNEEIWAYILYSFVFILIVLHFSCGAWLNSKACEILYQRSNPCGSIYPMWRCKLNVLFYVCIGCNRIQIYPMGEPRGKAIRP